MRSVTDPLLPEAAGRTLRWGRLYGSAPALAVASAARRAGGPVLHVTADAQSADRIESELRFYGGDGLEVLHFPDWETLPYDVFSPHQDIVSRRLATLYRLPELARGVVVVPANTLIQRLPPRAYVAGNVLLMSVGDRLDLDSLRASLEATGYRFVSQVFEHGDVAVRGSLIDIFPMGSEHPYRIDLFDDEIDTIRTFDPETQLSQDRLDRIRLLPARELPLDEAAIKAFRQRYRARFPGDPQRSLIYRDVSQGIVPGGIEYYLPLFFDTTETLVDYLPPVTTVITDSEAERAAAEAFEQAQERYEQRGLDPERPLLAPETVFLPPDEVEQALAGLPRVSVTPTELPEAADAVNYATARPPEQLLDRRSPEPAAPLRRFLEEFGGRTLFVAESAGRREALRELLADQELYPEPCPGWDAFRGTSADTGIAEAPLEQGLLLEDESLAVVTEAQLYGERPRPRRRRAARDPDTIVRDLADLSEGSPVVHEEHGVGRYLGLQTLTVAGTQTEFLTLEYAGGDKLYVPVASLHLISRYTGASPENAPLHRLGSDQWQRARRRAAEKIRDAAADLLEIQARRAARPGHALRFDEGDYQRFAADFPFEETPDQERAVSEVLADLRASRPMDRVVCGDVGFGKTEVAMRAAFAAVSGGKQVAVLVPTTLLAQQHEQTFRDRFADWPVRIEGLSRMRSAKARQSVLDAAAAGDVDIVIGTHQLLQKGLDFKDLGLVVVDEEHRFGVRHKERLKDLRARVDVLTLTATPIPRTLNMSLAGLRELSIIATPPAERLAVKTFVSEWQDSLIHEACLREIKRGGQVYFVHNKVDNIEGVAERIRGLMPEARVAVAHGQMRERDLEQVMLDFYHRRHNILVCTTIIESGLDVPTANTIVINRADRMGLAQLHQLRGRVGRSHHRAYAYLLAPPRRAMTADAVKRLEAIESLEDLGAGFTLATHDLEIRGAGELLGEEQSGQIQEIGFNLYSELLERAVEALKAGALPDPERQMQRGPEVELNIPALLPEDYMPDVHMRLMLYKRVASARNEDELSEIQVEMIDRFGLLPQPAKNLFRVTGLKLRAASLGVRKLEAGSQGGRLVFADEPDLDPAAIIELVQQDPQTYRLDGQHVLRFTTELTDADERVGFVTRLLDRIARGTTSDSMIQSAQG